MSKDFYKSPEYRSKQSALTKAVWRSGRFDSVYIKLKRKCRRIDCKNSFKVQPSDPKLYCSIRCAALVKSPGRNHSAATKLKISASLTGKKYPNRPKEPPRYSICLYCCKEFRWRYWRPATNPIKYFSRMCLIKDVGSRPTSPRAARAKAGIRLDIDSKIYFFSRWEANYARILNFKNIKWVHQPKVFRLKSQRYTPDFYLSETNEFVEIKNFLSEYSARRDKEFRELYPDIKLKLILKEDYLKMQNKFAPKIKMWEYS
jgi:hypothetical protein